MTDRALMQQALEALELEATRTPIPETAAAMAALRARLAEIDAVEVAAFYGAQDRARLAEPEPEPVAIHQFRKRGCIDWFDGHPDHTDGRGPYVSRTLYTAPPTRRPLTDSEADALAHEMVKGGKSVQWLVRAIERAHNITGGNDE